MNHMPNMENKLTDSLSLPRVLIHPPIQLINFSHARGSLVVVGKSEFDYHVGFAYVFFLLLLLHTYNDLDSISSLKVNEG